MALQEPAELGYILCYNTYVPTGRTAKAVDFMQKILTPLPSPNQTKSIKDDKRMPEVALGGFLLEKV